MLSALLGVIVVLLCQPSSTQALHRRLHSVPDLDDVDAALFPVHADPFAETDTWATLSDAARKSWSTAHGTVPPLSGMLQFLNAARAVQQKPTHVLVTVKIVSPSGVFREDPNRIQNFAAAMSAGGNGTALRFRVSVASSVLYARISRGNVLQHPREFSPVFRHDADTSGALNVMYVVMNHAEAPVTEYAERIPLVGEGRASWMIYNVPRASKVNLANLLTAIEAAAERVYAPVPLYFPVPFVQKLRVHVAAYTPGLDHHTKWLPVFDWNRFERGIRNIAVHGQVVGFFSTPVNTECIDCAHAFRDIESFVPDSVRRAAVILNGGKAPNETWALGRSTGSSTSVTGHTCFVYVVDTFKIRSNEAMQRLERSRATLFPGLAIVAFRSSRPDSAETLQSLLTSAVVGSAFGIANPGFYLNPSRASALETGAPSKPSALLADIVVRNLVLSIVQTRLNQLEEILNSFIHYDVDPAAALGERQFASLGYRINLLLLKLERAKSAISDSNDGIAGMHYASSAGHDIRAIRFAFGLAPDGPFPAFMEVALRCHFSRLKRGALLASQMIESRTVGASRVLLASCSFFLTMALSFTVVRVIFPDKSRRKRE